MIFKPQIVKPKVHIKDYNKIFYEYIQQPEIIEQLSKQLTELLKPYENREDIEIYLANGIEHLAFENDCLSIKVQIMIKPRKEIRYD